MSCPPRVREAFALFDNDGDGEISGREILLTIRSCGVIPTQEEMKSLPATMSWPDFEAWMSKKLSSCKPEEDLIKAFKVFDRSNDGTISTDELSQVMIALGELLSDEEVKGMIKDADPNGTGRIQYANFVKMLLA
ncbi:putative calmodulin [Neospora caninum Liverpool]|uniref:Calmodulin n=1 Tax=Neospora caninum (strain Liverpool) TaxID=572307 RepID=F0VJK4_NEOCL|nr:putative calmodulin [Neospora caninum Liverpool]CBZ53915.1 putative calmodulin [Neospora caninum Liverpool]CEL67913.1 TPA: calmodulin, putative [Neospora caninum Liverpool]|eukprot:XP_003883947.1 putative calmodulin [Neospora caninum Liverpool]